MKNVFSPTNWQFIFCRGYNIYFFYWLLSNITCIILNPSLRQFLCVGLHYIHRFTLVQACEEWGGIFKSYWLCDRPSRYYSIIIIIISTILLGGYKNIKALYEYLPEIIVKFNSPISRNSGKLINMFSYNNSSN